MLYRVLAGVVAAVHLGFVLFVVAGGLGVLRWPRLTWIHLPCAAYGAMIMLAGWVCPLTPLENALLRAGGAPRYGGGFVEHHLLSVVWPHGDPGWTAWALGVGVLAVNAAVYTHVLLARRA